MKRLWKENPSKFILKFVINLIYGVCIFGIFFIPLAKAFVPIDPEYIGYLSGLFVIFRTLKNGLEKINPNVKNNKKEGTPSSTIRMD